MKKIFFISMLFLNGLIFSQESGKCVAGDCENGEGTWIWDHGDKFEGYWEQGLYIDGVYSYKNGDEYEGTFKDSMKHGLIVFHFARRHAHEGL